MKRELEYKPQKRGFPYKILKNLYENGESAEWLLREEIGIDDWYASKGMIYMDRAEASFYNIIRDLLKRELIVITDEGYELTKSGKELGDILFKNKK
jgi:hypothetical protein